MSTSERASSANINQFAKIQLSPVKKEDLNGVKDLLKALLDLEIISVPHHEDKKKEIVVLFLM